MLNTEILNLTQELIRRGTTYDLEFLDHIYDEDLKFLRIDQENSIEVLSKSDNMQFFRTLKASDAAPLNDHAAFHYADMHGDEGFIILTRKMKQLDKEQEFLFNIYWKKKNGTWKIVREVVYIK